MVFWLGLAVLSAAVVAVVLAPLLRRRPPSGLEADPTAIYRDQLDELEADHARGVLSALEFESARAEIARRLLLSADIKADGTPSLAAQPHAARGVAFVIAAAVPLCAITIYLAIGAPQLPSQPHAARLKAPLETARVDELIRAVEARLRQYPDDGQGWDVVAPVYLKQGRFREAADAFSTAQRILGESAKRLAGFAEATVLDNDGIVTEPARIAYEKLAKLEPSRPEPRFWLALAKEQDGQLEAAATDYEALITSAPEGAPWVALVRERQEALRQRLAKAGDVSQSSGQAAQPSGPSADDVAAAEKMTPADRQKMIEGMVEGLAKRLAQDGRDISGWERLIRAYSTMGRKSDALIALANARRAFAGEEPSLAKLRDVARALGLES